jgi:membrane associated rhomboid family serine protease
MFLFPYGTNAPIYYWPVTTVGMIVANIAIFILCCLQPHDSETVMSLMLEIGNGIHPAQWLTCNFMHADIFHLGGNMIALWAFGLVVEGKLGACKTLFVYLGIGVLHGAIVQFLMLGGAQNYCLGASAIIYGFMAMCLIWAPENEMQCVCILIIFIYVRTFLFDVRIKIMVGLLVGLQLLILVFTGGAISSEFLHSVGAALGFGAGIWLLKAGWVDCENWDYFSVRAGRHTMSEEAREKLDAETPEGKQLAAERLQVRREKAADDIVHAIGEGMPQIALRIHQRMQIEQPGWTLAESNLLLLIRSLQSQKLWIESIPVMQEYISQYPHKAALVQLKLAQIFLVEDKRPRKALKVLDQINKLALDARQLDLLRKLRAKADELYGQDSYELMEE